MAQESRYARVMEVTYGTGHNSRVLVIISIVITGAQVYIHTTTAHLTLGLCNLVKINDYKAIIIPT